MPPIWNEGPRRAKRETKTQTPKKEILRLWLFLLVFFLSHADSFFFRASGSRFFPISFLSEHRCPYSYLYRKKHSGRKNKHNDKNIYTRMNKATAAAQQQRQPQQPTYTEKYLHRHQIGKYVLNYNAKSCAYSFHMSIELTHSMCALNYSHVNSIQLGKVFISLVLAKSFHHWLNTI